MSNSCDIDFVITWVDGSDSDWIKDFNEYASLSNHKNEIDVRSERYKEHGLLRYWFRGVETFAPWVRTIHFVTNGQKPKWLNLNAQKLHFVKHSDYIPKEYLPVFSSHPIELMLHKIPGLSEKFIYFNDDFYLVSPVRESYYFKYGLPCDSASFSVIGLGKDRTRIPHILLNNMVEINKNFEKQIVVSKNPIKWFNPKYGKNFIKNLFMIPWNTIACISPRHHAQPYLKSTFENVWKNCSDALSLTMHHRFRDRLQDVNQWLFRFWQLCEGNFYPANHNHKEKMISLSEWQQKDSDAIMSHKYTEICIDDDTDENSIVAFEEKMFGIIATFEKILPKKSSFEL